MKKTARERSSISTKRVSATSAGRRPRAENDTLRSHYDFDYSKSRPNRFAAAFREGAVAVVLEPDVASIFNSSESVNAFLRSAIAAMPRENPTRKAARRKSSG